MNQYYHPTLLAVGVADLESKASLLDVYSVTNTREAIATMRLVGFDLILAGLDNPEINIWDMMGRIMSAWPQQRWLLASSQVSLEDEIHARALGALMVLSEVPREDWLFEYATSLRQRELHKCYEASFPVSTPVMATQT
jgi:DNA-binding NarL/FixJ family response regulator